MAENSSLVAEAVVEDELADFGPIIGVYDVRCPEFKNRDLRDNAFQELAKRLGTTCSET